MNNLEIKTLYPAIEPFDQGFFKVSELHELYYEQSGNPNGEPVIFLHGGPGGGSSPAYRQFFDPSFYRVIIFDQRGCGQSKPLGCLEDNNTDALIQDVEKLREYFKIDKWIVFGGSWGSTLSLAYAIKHADRAKTLVLRGIFLARQKDMDWLFENDAAARIFPDYFEDYLNYLPEDERENLIDGYYKRLTSTDQNLKNEAGKKFSDWENKISKLVHDKADDNNDIISPKDLANACIESLYMKEKCFFVKDYLLDNLKNIVHIPTYIVHGRYDIVCSTSNAWDLYKEWCKVSDNKYKPELVSSCAGHSQMETENIHNLVTFMEKIKFNLSENIKE